MATLTVRLPDDKHMRLKALAKRKHISINKLMEELSTQAIAEFDAETRFRAMAARGDVTKALPFSTCSTVLSRSNAWARACGRRPGFLIQRPLVPRQLRGRGPDGFSPNGEVSYSTRHLSEGVPLTERLASACEGHRR